MAAETWHLERRASIGSRTPARSVSILPRGSFACIPLSHADNIRTDKLPLTEAAGELFLSLSLASRAAGDPS